MKETEQWEMLDPDGRTVHKVSATRVVREKECKRCGKKAVLTNQGLCYDCLDIDRQ